MAQSRFSHGSGPSQRQLRVGEVVRRRLSDVLARGDIHDPDLNRHSITVGEVRLSPDLKIATAYVLPLGGQLAPEALGDLRRNAAELRHLMGKELGLKYTPQLRFELDETFDRMDETRRLFEDARVRRDIEAADDESADDDAADADEGIGDDQGVDAAAIADPGAAAEGDAKADADAGPDQPGARGHGPA